MLTDYGQKTLAIFDMDHTLVDADTPNLWFQYLCDKGHVDREDIMPQREVFNEQYLAGELDVDELIAFEGRQVNHETIETLNIWRAEFLHEYVTPKVTQKARDWVRLHRIGGDELILATASNSFLGEGVGELLGIKHIIATQLEASDGHYTGKRVGISSYGKGKLTRINEWIQANGGSLQTATFYSDSHNDLPLLRAVKTPIVVDPDTTLLHEAESKDWKIISKY